MKKRKNTWKIEILNNETQREFLLGLLNSEKKQETITALNSIMEPVYIELAKQIAAEEIKFGNRGIVFVKNDCPL